MVRAQDRTQVRIAFFVEAMIADRRKASKEIFYAWFLTVISLESSPFWSGMKKKKET
jgi:hypothetical protein